MARIKYSTRCKKIEDFNKFKNFIENNQLSADGNIVLLTKENAEIIEALIKNDPDYFPFSQLVFNHFGIDKIKKNTENSLFAIARELDRDNSTNVWRYKKNRDDFNKMIEYITNPNNNFFDRLEEGDIKLPDEIVNNCGTSLKSLSSKICKYLSEFAFQKDNYYINDSVVRRILLFYLDYYGVPHPNINSSYTIDDMNYEVLYGWIEKLHNTRNEKYNDRITKNELDHILWYCYKLFNDKEKENPAD